MAYHFIESESKPSNYTFPQMRSSSRRLVVKFPSENVPVAAARNNNPHFDNFRTINIYDTEHNKLKPNNQKCATTTLEKISGSIHDQISKISLGSGSSKEESQQNTENVFLKTTNDGINNNAITSTIKNSSRRRYKNEYSKEVIEMQSKINVIGTLQELCISRKWPLPHYRYELGKCSHIVECSLDIYKTKGEQPTKQAAKTQAARIMYDQVKSLLFEETVLDDNTNKHITPVKASSNCLNSIENLAKDVQKYLEIFYKNLKLSTNPSINKLLIYDSIHAFSRNSVNILYTIGKEEGFCPVYTILSSENNEILVEIFITPFLVNFATGETVGKAQEAAAYAALIHLKLMLKN